MSSKVANTCEQPFEVSPKIDIFKNHLTVTCAVGNSYRAEFSEIDQKWRIWNTTARSGKYLCIVSSKIEILKSQFATTSAILYRGVQLTFEKISRSGEYL